VRYFRSMDCFTIALSVIGAAVLVTGGLALLANILALGRRR
jgi:hypothetical protein